VDKTFYDAVKDEKLNHDKQTDHGAFHIKMNQENLHFTNHANETLAATLHLPDTPGAAGVVLGHCFTCSRHTRILRAAGASLAKHGIMALRFDFSGNGQSQGIFAESTFSKQVREMQAATAILKDRGAVRIGLAGHSMGASVAVLTGADTENVKAVCAVAGRLTGSEPERFLSAEQQIRFNRDGEAAFTSRGRELRLTRSFVDDVKSYDLPTILHRYALPLLIIHGDQDEIIAVDVAHDARQFNPHQIQLDIIAGADHMFSQENHKTLAVEKMTQWFLANLT